MSRRTGEIKSCGGLNFPKTEIEVKRKLSLPPTRFFAPVFGPFRAGNRTDRQ